MDQERRPLDGRCRVPDREVPVRFFAVILVALVLGTAARAASTSVLHRREHRQVRHLSAYVGTVRFFDHHRWLVRRPPTRPIALRELRVAHVWIRVIRRELAETRAQLQPKPTVESWLYGAFMCIHRYEGAWDANTGNGYHGGLQMDATFQSTYGPEFVRRWGGAENWPVWAQVAAAVRAYKSGRGFGPWPNTARACGLL